MLWVEHRRGEVIPKELFYDGFPTDRAEYNRTLLMIWIRSHYGKGIPK